MESRDYSQRPQSLLGVGPGPGSGPPDGYNYYNNNYDRGEQSRPGGPKWLQGAGRHEYYLPHSHPPAHQIHHSDQQISPYHQHHSSGNAPPPMSNRYEIFSCHICYLFINMYFEGTHHMITLRTIKILLL